jgi:hypothetical protein
MQRPSMKREGSLISMGPFVVVAVGCGLDGEEMERVFARMREVEKLKDGVLRPDPSEV